ncbi:tetratricopeptide repeat protein [Shewanella sp. OMA3-2]|uniref:tetratricopeptide repeat protein n=1 Tax=Shewanella sp. OMA3-2 TaxID=2908650 RepID=UPI001F3B58A0|nr:tetratricopeptide repeat protein [Shewanella sp. OMA3-2]UJF21184.1 tetratricopeptide repeat protein [Shewanella sp. OMA3-2]
MQFINQARSLTSNINKLLTALLVIIMVMLLQSCASAPDSANSNTDKGSLGSLGKDIVGMVDTKPSRENNSNSHIISNSTQNRYLEQVDIKLANVPKSVISQYQQAIELMRRQQWQAADKMLDKVITAQPQLSGAYVNKALSALQQDNIAAANSLLDKAILVNADNPYAHQIKASLLRTQGQYEQAEQHYRSALAIWPQYPEAQVNLAILLELYRGQYLEARQYYLAYLANQSDNQQVKRWLAGVEIKMQRAGLIIPADISTLEPKYMPKESEQYVPQPKEAQ